MRELSLNILDIIMNSVEAESTRVILVVEEIASRNMIRIRIRDNGRGMSDDLKARVLDPFVTTRTTRAVGMGLSMFRQIAVACNGDLTLSSTLGKGTTVTIAMLLNHLNRPPMGQIADTIVNLIMGSLDIHFCYLHSTESGRFRFDSYWLFGRMAERDYSIYDMTPIARDHLTAELARIRARLY
jgi:hypothetical protein